MRALDAPIVTIIVVLLVITGCVDILLDGSLSKDYERLLKAIDLPLGLLAVGRGWAARKPG